MTELSKGFPADDGLAVINAHFCGSEEYPCSIDKGVALTDTHKHYPNEVISDFLQDFTSVSTIRDPLLSLITRQVRQPDLPHFYIIDGFVTLSELVQKHKLFLVSVDLLRDFSYKSKLNYLRKVLDYVGLADESYVRLWAVSWPMFNSTPELPEPVLHTAYEKGDLELIVKAFPEEYEYLKSKESVLKPFLQDQGYANLLWWEK
jgi:hypothetical protein